MLIAQDREASQESSSKCARADVQERNGLIRSLQEISLRNSVRITILGGDVHLGAIGQFYSNKKLNIPLPKDHRYMPNVISSAIVNTPPSETVGDLLYAPA
jgi:hypothetical protein